MPTLDLSSIVFRAFALGDETTTEYISIHGSPTDNISLSAIKFRAFQAPAVIEIDIGEGGYSPGMGSGSSGGVGDGTNVTAYASLTTALAGVNNDLTFTAKYSGISGNNINITYIVQGINTPLAVVVMGTDIVVYVATDGSGNPISTAAQIKAAIEADPAANDLVVVTYPPGNNGTGIVTAMGTAYLFGGIGPAQPIQIGNYFTLNPFMPNGIARLIPPKIYLTVISNIASATASINAPSFALTIVSPPAIANASVVAPSIGDTTIFSVPALATASVTTPTILITVTAIATSTASVVAPIPLIDVPSVVAISTASVVAPVIQISVTTVAIATANQITLNASVTIGITQGVNAIASVTPPIVGSVTTVFGVAAVATASVVAPIVSITVIAPIAMATASVTAPTISTGEFYGGEGIFGQDYFGET